MVSEQMCFWGHDDVGHVFLEPAVQGAEFGVVLWKSGSEESQERASRIHVDLDEIRGGERGDIGAV